MAVPTVGNVIASGGTAANATSLILTLTAVANVGDIVLVFACTAGVINSVTDTGGNTYPSFASFSAGSRSLYALGCIVNKKLNIGDTITIGTSTSVPTAAFAVQFTGIPQNVIKINTTQTSNSTVNSGSSTSASSNSLSPTNVDDSLFVLVVGTSGATLLTSDFTSGSVDQSYTRLSQAISTGSATNVGVCMCYKTVATTNPLPTQNPTFTLNLSRGWTTAVFQFSGLTARGSIGTHLLAPGSAGSSRVIVPMGVLGKLNYGPRGKSINDAFPNQIQIPSEDRVGQQEADGMLVSD